ncbi:MAG: SLC13 family permease, partial [Desulfobacterales bacterium]|nr:SLC13 family permease [Desulfobacterales bacterium]
ILGLVEGRETFKGLSSTAVISIIAVIIMGRGLDHTGVVNRGIRPLLRMAGASRRRMILLLSGTVALISSFMQNIGAAALFLPAIQRMSRKTNTPISQLLMPVGFSAIMGGTITLVGSSPLIMLNDLLRPFGIKPFSLFSVTPIGIAILLTGIVYFIVIGRFVLPRETSSTNQQLPDKNDPLVYYPELIKLFELETPTGKDLELKVLDLCDNYNVHTVALSSDGGLHKILPPDRDLHIVPGSVFAVYASQEHVEEAAKAFGFRIKPGLEVFAEDLSRDFSGVVEAIVSPHSSFVGKTLMQVRFRHNHLMAPMAIVHQGQIHYRRLGSRLLEPGDVILIHGRWESIQRMRPKRDLLFAQPLHHEVLLTHKATNAIACFVLATALVIFTSLPISICLMTGALGMILTNVLRIDEAYQGIDWRTVFLLSGLIPLGLAMQKTQAASWLAHHLLNLIGTPSPSVFILAVGMMTTALTLVVSNVGATVLLVPMVFDMAGSVGVDPRLAALVVGLAASNSFLLPTHQVNALYMGPGGYTSFDFLKAGLPLSILYLLVLTAIAVLFY